MANFGNRSDAITILRNDVTNLLNAYRQLNTDLVAMVDFDYFNASLAAGTAPLVNADFVGSNSDYATAAAFYADMVAINDLQGVLVAARRKALSRLSAR